MMKRLVLLLALLSTACNRGTKPEAPTPAETERLNDAEAMLNSLANEEGPAPESTGPSNSSE